MPKLLLWTSFAIYVLLIVVVTLQNIAGPEYKWWSTINLYVPQILWGVPAVLLSLTALFFARKPWWLPLLFISPLLYVAGPMMGWCGLGPFGSAAAIAADPKNALRVMTYNIAGGSDDLLADGLAKEIAVEQPDVLLLQENGGGIDRVLKAAHPDWHIQTDGEWVIATRLPLVSHQKISLPKLVSDPWKSPGYIRCVVQVGKVPIVVYNVHLSTPRPALEALRHRDPGAVTQLESNTTTRLMQATAIAQAAFRETAPTLVAGDFNAPEPSLLCRKIERAGLRDAFSLRGKGYGYTTGHEFRFHQSYSRIDHIYASPAWRIHDCDVGDKEASDHRPVIATLSLAP